MDNEVACFFLLYFDSIKRYQISPILCYLTYVKLNNYLEKKSHVYRMDCRLLEDFRQVNFILLIDYLLTFTSIL